MEETLGDMLSVVLVGAPNVGKSSLVSLISSKQPEVNHYPFTTRGILIGNMEWNDQQKLKCQIMDTPVADLAKSI